MTITDSAMENQSAERAMSPKIRFRWEPELRAESLPPPNQIDTFRLPRGFEQLGAPLNVTEQSRAYLVSLPNAGMNQFAHEIRVAIDSGEPIQSVTFDVDFDREEGWDELVAKLDVRLPGAQAIEFWERLENRMFVARQQLSPAERARMEEGFALYVRWEPNPDS